jgi:iron complex transport system permease protein
MRSDSGIVPGTAGGSVKRAAVAFPILIVVLALAVLAGIGIGAVPIPPISFLRWIAKSLGFSGFPMPSRTESTIIFMLRLPRVLCSILVGSALAVCGVAMQGLFRNPLASPEVLGISAGSSLGAVIAITSGLFTASLFVLPIMAAAGALSAAALVFLLSSSRGSTSLLYIVLAGMAISSFFSGIVSALLLVSREHEVSVFIFWTMGGLDGRGWEHVLMAAPILIPGMVVIGAFSRDLNLFTLGEESASSLGMRVERVKKILLAVSAVVTGAAISVGGPIGFLGLLIPHLFRLLIGPDHRLLIPASALGGAAFLTLCDLLGRVIIPPYEVRVGIITALLGSPYFLFLVVRTQRRGTGR